MQKSLLNVSYMQMFASWRSWMHLRAIGRQFTQMNSYFLVMNSKRCLALSCISRCRQFKWIGTFQLHTQASLLSTMRSTLWRTAVKSTMYCYDWLDVVAIHIMWKNRYIIHHWRWNWMFIGEWRKSRLCMYNTGKLVGTQQSEHFA